MYKVNLSVDDVKLEIEKYLLPDLERVFKDCNSFDEIRETSKEFVEKVDSLINFENF